MERDYKVYLWPGMGYLLSGFRVTATCPEQALEKVTADLIKNGQTGYYYTQEEYDKHLAWAGIEEEQDDQYLYVDATMEGAPYPVYLLIENMKVEIAS